MADLSVSSDAVRAASGDVTGYLAEFEERLQQAAGVVSAVVGSDWSGSAAKEFHAGWVEWKQGAAEIHTALAGMARLLAEAAGTYETTETHVAKGAAN